MQTGCFPGDTPGLPVTISTSGSYRLASNLSAAANVDGISLNISRVTLDFNGFSLTGGTIGSGIGNGIAGGGTNGSAAGRTTIKNGVIRDARARGVALGGAEGVRIENMTFDFNAGGGIAVGTNARVLKNTFTDNGSTSLNGMSVGTGVLIEENVVSGSGFSGISVGDGSTVSGNTADGNGRNGIEATSGSSVKGNMVRNNTNFGLALGANAGYRENLISSNTTGQVFGGVDAGANVINGVVTPTP